MYPAPHASIRPRPLIRISPLALLLGLVALLSALRPGPARATTIVVNTLADVNGGSDCSLRNAVQAAHTQAPFGGCTVGGTGNDLITFSVQGTIHLTLGSLGIPTGTLTIQGPGSNQLTIDAGGNGRLFVLEAGVQLTLEGLTLTGGWTSAARGSGGAILNNGGTLTISNSIVINNETADGNGGAIDNEGGRLTITDSTFANNRALKNPLDPLNVDGGAIYNNGGNLFITGSTFNGNQARDNGGAIYHFGGAITLSGSTFRDNRSVADDGGALYINQAMVTVDVTTSTFDRNTAADRAGAIYIFNGRLNLAASTLSNNFSGGYGGALYSDGGTLNIENSTFAGNRVATDYSGGAIYHDDNTLAIKNSTIANNDSGRLATLHVNSGSVRLQNVLLKNPSPNCSGTITDQGGNIASDAACAFSQMSSRNSTDPLLLPLANNGGPTQTMALSTMPRSPAIGAAVPPCPATDQRGVMRGTPCDSGAFQTTSVPPVAPTITGLTPSSGPAAGGTLVTITGTGFSTMPSATTVAFGPTPATNVVCASASQCTATSPAGMGTVDVRVTVAGQTSPLTRADQFTYQPSPPAQRSRRRHHRLHGAGQQRLSLHVADHARGGGAGEHSAAGGHQRRQLPQPLRRGLPGRGRQPGLCQPTAALALPGDQQRLCALRSQHQHGRLPGGGGDHGGRGGERAAGHLVHANHLGRQPGHGDRLLYVAVGCLEALRPARIAADCGEPRDRR